jgi:glycosyltransferase involved in cell wall biosynthesis
MRFATGPALRTKPAGLPRDTIRWVRRIRQRPRIAPRAVGPGCPIMFVARDAIGATNTRGRPAKPGPWILQPVSLSAEPPTFPNHDFSVVIVTHNRRHLVARAIVSALTQEGGAPEVIVVDDASTDGTSRYVTTAFPDVRFHRRDTAQGPSVCRNCGMRMARGRWVIVLDDDDELRPDAIQTIGARLAAFADAGRYPVLKFRRTDGTLIVPFQLSRVPDLSDRTRHGDFASVWNRELGLALGLAYPEHFLGAEGVLWVDIAARFGLPTWADCVVIAHRDAGTQLSDGEIEVRHAVERAKIEDGFVAALGPYESSESVRRVVIHRTLLAGVYWLLAGERRKALKHARTLVRRQPRAAVKLALATCLPTSLVVRHFLARRQREDAARAEAPRPESGWE